MSPNKMNCRRHAQHVYKGPHQQARSYEEYKCQSDFCRTRRLVHCDLFHPAARTASLRFRAKSSRRNESTGANPKSTLANAPMQRTSQIMPKTF